MRDLDTSLLRAFVTVAETGKVSSAAGRLARTQAAVSMQIRRLEDDVGHRLFDRSPRGLKLTEPGQVLLGFARQALGTLDAARAALEQSEVVGAVRLGVIEDVAVGGLTGQLAQFCSKYPDVRLDLIVDRGPNLEVMLGRGELEICISAGHLPGRTPRIVRSHHLQWVAAPSLDQTKFQELPLVLSNVSEPNPWRDHALTALTESGRKWRVSVTSTTLAAAWTAILGGLGVGLMLDVAADAFGLTSSPALVTLPNPPVVPISVYTTHFTQTDPAAMTLARYIEDAWHTAS